jgi:hypothetical protein
MKLKSLIILSLAFTLIAAVGLRTASAQTSEAVKLPSAKKVIKAYVKALGGKKANKKIKTRIAKGTIEIPAAGIKGTTETFTAAPAKSYSVGKLSGIGELIESFDGTTGWSMNPLQGNRDKAAAELTQAKLISDFYREIELNRLYPKIEVKGLDKVGDAAVYKVVATPEGGLPPETWYFDIKTGLLLRSDATLVTPEGSTGVKNYFEDYREVDGVKMPFKTRSVLPQFELVTTLTEVKHNVPIDDAKFAKPKP